jgi:DNA-binding transcriptional MerR regulator
MPRETLTWDQLFAGLEPQPAFVQEMERLGLLRVVARNAAGKPLYGAEAREELEKVLELVELGYQLKDIAAIASRVGLPRQRRRLFRRPPTYLRLDELARACGAPVERLSAWLEGGVIEPDLVSDGGGMHFAPAAVERVRLLEDLLTLGLEEAELIGHVAMMCVLEEGGARDAPLVHDRGQLDAAAATLATLSERLQRISRASRRWEKLVAVYRKRLARVERARVPDPAPRTGRRSRVHTRTRGRKGPGSEDGEG